MVSQRSMLIRDDKDIDRDVLNFNKDRSIEFLFHERKNTDLENHRIDTETGAVEVRVSKYAMCDIQMFYDMDHWLAMYPSSISEEKFTFLKLTYGK